jgi:hypothetical protein
MGKFIPDVDIDVADRNAILSELPHIAASMVQDGDLVRHNVGVYFQSIPTDPLTNLASIPYKEAEERGYFKVDFLPLNIYKNVRDEQHLSVLVEQEPIWELLLEPDVTQNLFQLSGIVEGIPTSELLSAYKPTTIIQLAMFLALIRPRKKHLIGLSWEEVEAEIWTPGDPDLYGFKKAHAVSYACVVVVQMNLLTEGVIAEPIIFEDSSG